LSDESYDESYGDRLIGAVVRRLPEKWIERLEPHPDTIKADMEFVERHERLMNWLRDVIDILRHKLLDADQKSPKGFLIDLLVPPDRAEDMLLGLEKGFERWVLKYGVRGARRRFLWHSVWSVIGFWINWMMKHLKLLKFLASGRG
jgi:hypothetical protein